MEDGRPLKPELQQQIPVASRIEAISQQPTYSSNWSNLNWMVAINGINTCRYNVWEEEERKEDKQHTSEYEKNAHEELEPDKNNKRSGEKIRQ